MDTTSLPKVVVVPPGAGETVPIPGFGAVYKLYSRDNGGAVAIVEHPFAGGLITAPHRHTGPCRLAVTGRYTLAGYAPVYRS